MKITGKRNVYLMAPISYEDIIQVSIFVYGAPFDNKNKHTVNSGLRTWFWISAKNLRFYYNS